MLVKSCFLITLIKCLKSHKSPGSIFAFGGCVKFMTEVTSMVSATGWTAKFVKKGTNDNEQIRSLKRPFRCLDLYD